MVESHLRTYRTLLAFLLLVGFSLCVMLCTDLSSDVFAPSASGAVMSSVELSDFSSLSMTELALDGSDHLVMARDRRDILHDFRNRDDIAERENVYQDGSKGEVGLVKFLKHYGGEGSEEGFSVENTADGGYIIAGYATAPNDDDRDVYVVKIDGTGGEEWNRTFTSPGNEEANDVVECPDGGYAVLGYRNPGGSNSDLLLMRLNETGSALWTKAYGADGPEMGSSIIIEGDGFVVLGSKSGAGLSGHYDYWLMKLDGSGTEEWSKTYEGGHEAADVSRSLISSGDGGYVMTGMMTRDVGGDNVEDVWLVKTDGSGSLQWSRNFGGSKNDNGYSVSRCSDGGYIVAGSTESYGAGDLDAWLIRTDSQGNKQWDRTFGGSDRDHASSVLQCPDGGYALSGKTVVNGPLPSLWIFRTDASGIERWNKTVGGYYEWANCLARTPDGHYIAAGTTYSYGDESDVFVVQVDDQGEVVFETGTITSPCLTGGAHSFSFLSLGYETFIPMDTSMDIQISNDNASWCDLAGNAGQWTSMDSGTEVTDLSGLGWSGSIFHYRVRFISDVMEVPTLKRVNVSFEGYAPMGAAVSLPVSSGTPSQWKELAWDSVAGQGTEMTFQLRGAETEAGLVSAPFGGPGGPETFYTVSPSPLSLSHRDERWLQYRVIMSSEVSVGPELREVSLTYNAYPALTLTGVEPFTGEVHTVFNFSLVYSDRENMPPAYVNTVIDGMDHAMHRSDEGEVNYTSGVAYYLETRLDPGLHSYQFSTSDGDLEILTEMRELNVTILGAVRIEVEPAEAILGMNDTASFSAFAFYLEEGAIPVNATWSAEGGGVMDENGTFRAGTPGVWTIQASIGGLSGSATVTVTDLNITRLEIVPASPDGLLYPGDAASFAVKGYDSVNNSLPISPTWGVSGGGTISSNGTFLASEAGTWKIFARASDVTTSISITVLPLPVEVTRIEVDPAAAEVKAGAAKKFSAVAYDADDVEVSVAFQWSVDGDGTVDGQGLFTAGGEGTCKVKAGYGNVSGSADVNVVPASGPSKNGGEKGPAVATSTVILVVVLVLLLLMLSLVFVMKRRKGTVTRAPVERETDPGEGDEAGPVVEVEEDEGGIAGRCPCCDAELRASDRFCRGCGGTVEGGK